jgi:uncharacterized membrane protein YhaH (DUF805 family)
VEHDLFGKPASTFPDHALALNRGHVMGFGQAITAGFSNYANFHDRASRSEYWYWALFILLGTIGAYAIDVVMAAAILRSNEVMAYQWGNHVFTFGLVVLTPGIAIGVRRLHDLDRSGWWLLLAFIPLIGAIILLIWHCTKGTAGPNRFGPDPLETEPMSAAPHAA